MTSTTTAGREVAPSPRIRVEDVKALRPRSKCCGRCGGTGRYHVGQYAEARTCYGCNGAGRIQSAQAIRNFDAAIRWRAENNATQAEMFRAILDGMFGKTWVIVLTGAETAGSR